MDSTLAPAPHKPPSLLARIWAETALALAVALTKRVLLTSPTWPTLAALLVTLGAAALVWFAVTAQPPDDE